MSELYPTEESVPIKHDDALVLDVAVSSNRKITPLARFRTYRRKGGKVLNRYDEDLVMAAFGIASGPEQSCAGATEYCANDCYSMAMERDLTMVGNRMRANYEALKNATPAELNATCSAVLRQYLERCEDKGVPPEKRIFRWHWAGDVFSVEYAQAIAGAFRENPGAVGAIYTRVFQPELNVVPYLVGVPNLNVYLSTDPDNWERAVEVYLEHPDELRFSILGEDYTHVRGTAAKIATELEHRGHHAFDVKSLLEAEVDETGYMPYSYPGILYCPEEYPYGRLKSDGSRQYMDLTVPFRDDLKAEQLRVAGSDEPLNMRDNVRHRGACSACMACYGPSNRHVMFVKNKLMHHRNGARNSVGQAILGEEVEVPVTITPKAYRSVGSRALDNQASVEEPPTLF